LSCRIALAATLLICGLMDRSASASIRFSPSPRGERRVAPRPDPLTTAMNLRRGEGKTSPHSDSPAQVPTPADLANLGLQDLMEIEVTSVSRRSENLSNAAASIFVITGEQIRRSGATTVPDALRLAPNLQVAQSHANGYSISARGFNNSAANKLLVLIDGRSVYTPLFSGVFWDAQDVMLEDVERIEVISGPGGTLWGVNAVNGVINIITRSAPETRGGIASGATGNRESGLAVRHGAALGASGDYRVHAKYFHRNHSETEAGTRKEDAQHRTMGGFRADWDRPSGRFTVMGAAYKGESGQPLPGTISISGFNLQLGTIDIAGASLFGSWKRALSKASDVTVQAYYDRTERTVPPTFAEALDIADLQVLYSIRTKRQTISGGGEYRYVRDDVTNSPYIAFLPARVNQKWASVFVQDEVALTGSLRLTLGARVEHNDYTGAEVLPNARLGWGLAPGHLLWAAASHTVRAPSRLDRDTFVPGTPPFLLTGGPDVRSETANVYELGYRGQVSDSVTYSIAAFHAVYDHLRTQEIAPSQTSVFFANGMNGTTHGVEMWGAIQVSRRWRLTGGFSGLKEDLRLEPWSNDLTAPDAQEGSDPNRTWTVQSLLGLPNGIELDVMARRVSALSSFDIPAYLRLDVRFGWRPRRGLELSLTGQNLFETHAEFSPAATRTEFGRSFVVSVRRRFGKDGS
jgi:iron complex outermembrane recepter protein